MSDEEKTTALTTAEQRLDVPAEVFRSGENPATISLSRPWRFGMANHRARYTDVEGMAIVEGDIAVGKAEEVKTAPVALGNVRTGEQYRWPNGLVPYTAEAVVASLVAGAIKHWEERTPIRFVRRTPENAAEYPDYLAFKRLRGCWSYVGRQGKEQDLSLGTGCSLGSAIHEIGHALGLWHEQGRSDRDQHVKIVEANIDPQHLHNFDKQVAEGLTVGAYDFGSIMHYPAAAFSTNGKDTIVTLNGEPIGQRSGLSAGDIDAIRALYPDLAWEAAGGGTGG